MLALRAVRGLQGVLTVIASSPLLRLAPRQPRAPRCHPFPARPCAQDGKPCFLSLLLLPFLPTKVQVMRCEVWIGEPLPVYNPPVA